MNTMPKEGSIKAKRQKYKRTVQRSLGNVPEKEKERKKLRRKSIRQRQKFEKENREDILQFQETHKCIICWNVLYRPMKLGDCGHKICELCLHVYILTKLRECYDGIIVCPMCRQLVLSVPEHCKSTWDSILENAKRFWSKEQLKTHIKLNSKHWNNHVQKQHHSMNWKTILTATWNEKLVNDFKNTRVPPYDARYHDVPSFTVEVNRIVIGKLKDKIVFFPNRMFDFESPYCKAKLEPVYYVYMYDLPWVRGVSGGQEGSSGTHGMQTMFSYDSLERPDSPSSSEYSNDAPTLSANFPYEPLENVSTLSEALPTLIEASAQNRGNVAIPRVMPRATVSLSQIPAERGVYRSTTQYTIYIRQASATFIFMDLEIHEINDRFIDTVYGIVAQFKMELSQARTVPSAGHSRGEILCINVLAEMNRTELDRALREVRRRFNVDGEFEQWVGRFSGNEINLRADTSDSNSNLSVPRYPGALEQEIRPAEEIGDSPASPDPSDPPGEPDLFAREEMAVPLDEESSTVAEQVVESFLNHVERQVRHDDPMLQAINTVPLYGLGSQSSLYDWAAGSSREDSRRRVYYMDDIWTTNVRMSTRETEREGVRSDLAYIHDLTERIGQDSGLVDPHTGDNGDGMEEVD